MNRMNASDIIKAKQSRTLYQAYYRPTFFTTIINSTINVCPISTVNTLDNITSSFTSSITINYLSRCTPPSISYELANSINNGRYLCEPPYNSTIAEWNTGEQFTAGNSDCKVSFLTWKNTNPTLIHFYKSTSISTVSIFSTSIFTGPSPLICPLVDFNQPISFQDCGGCNDYNGCNDCCDDCSYE
jgi:hypothetical protein